MWPLASGFFRSAGCFQGPAVRWRVSGLHSLSGLNNTPWCGQPAFCLPVRPTMDIWVVSTLAVVSDAAVNIHVPGFTRTGPGGFGAQETHLFG